MRSHSGISHPSAVIREARRETAMTGPFAPTRMARGNEGKERASARLWRSPEPHATLAGTQSGEPLRTVRPASGSQTES